ncbi:MAG: hypothetical protein JRE64_01105 [Deltaproteobacteria bacterium]|nr:hypothetical protein [Deltaproteobacteria bacterium]
MTQTILDFETELYQEHLEEASFLYEQRLTLFDDPEVTWEDIHDFEERFEPHIDGLLVGEELALNVCKTQATEGDFGELHAAVRVFCRQNSKDLVVRVLEELDPEDAESLQAVSDALKHELPEDWQDEFVRMLSEGDQKLIPILANVFGFRRIKAGNELLNALGVSPTDSLPIIIWALGRLGEQDAHAPLLQYLSHEDEAVTSTTALALLRLGEEQTITQFLQHARLQNWPLIPLGLGGNRSAVNVILEKAKAGKAETDCLISLGLLGDISVTDTLLEHLTDAETGESAAMSLQTLTGADLYEDVFIPDEIDEDELFEEELKKFKEGQVPTRLDGEPFGITITRISQKPEDWQKWWAENKSHFYPGIRYRNGKPYSPACLLENLQSEKSPRLVRQMAYEELVIRYGIDFPFETDMLVSQQKQAIAKYAEWIKTNGSRFREGEWYFAGQLMSNGKWDIL